MKSSTGTWCRAFVAPALGAHHPEQLVGVHVDATTVGFIPFGEVTETERETMTDVERARLDRLATYLSAMEAPELLVGDIQTFFRALG